MYETYGRQIPANTTEDDKIVMECPISLGIITDVYIGFPAGCTSFDEPSQTTFRLARCRLKRGESNIIPRSPSDYIAADDFVVHAGPVNFPVLTGDAILSWELWNLDDTYPHELWMGVNWLTQEELQASLEAMQTTAERITQLRQLLQTFFRIPG